MKTDLMLHEFKRIVEAPDAIASLRRFVLDLAVRGCLVSQNPSDEPASLLVQRIAKRRNAERMGEMDGREKNTPPETPFPIPESWAWVPATFPARLVSETGKKIQTKDVGETGRYPVVDQGRVLIRGYSNDSEKVLLVENPIVLFGDHTRNVKYIDFDFVVGADGVKLLEPVEIVPLYYFLVLRWLPLGSRGYGRHFKLLRQSQIPLPPLAEQHRIVAKVDELMALCDEWEIAQKERELQRDALRSVLLHRLTAEDDDDAGTTADVRFFLDTSPRLITKPEHLTELRQSILDLAVRGRLVKRDAGDEPALTLRARLDDERARGGAERRRRQGDMTAIEPMKLPNHWESTHLYRLAASIDYGTSQLATLDARGVPVLRMGNITDGKISLNNLKYVEQGQIDDSLLLSPGDLIFNRTNSAELVGKNAVFLGSVSPITFASYLIRVRPLPSSDMRWVNAVLMSDSGRQYLASVQSQQTGQANINGTKLAEAPIPLPPLAEQQRIVAKVDELMAVCDDLEAALCSAQLERRRLLESLLHEALGDTARTMAPA